MSIHVYDTNISNKPCPQSLEELVNFVNCIKNYPSPIFKQISGLGVEVVQSLSVLLGTNFFNTEDTAELNPFTVIYIDHEGTIKSHMINEKSKLIIYARRSVHHH